MNGDSLPSRHRLRLGRGNALTATEPTCARTDTVEAQVPPEVVLTRADVQVALPGVGGAGVGGEEGGVGGKGWGGMSHEGRVGGGA